MLQAGFLSALLESLREDQLVREPEQLRTYECDGLTGHKVVPSLVALPLVLAVTLASALSLGARYTVRRAPTWGCGGELSARTEYTATAFSKPLMMWQPKQP